MAKMSDDVLRRLYKEPAAPKAYPFVMPKADVRPPTWRDRARAAVQSLRWRMGTAILGYDPRDDER